MDTAHRLLLALTILVVIGTGLGMVAIVLATPWLADKARAFLRRFDNSADELAHGDWPAVPRTFRDEYHFDPIGSGLKAPHETELAGKVQRDHG